MRRAHEFAGWCAGCFAAHGNLVARDQDLLDFPFQVGDGFETLSDPGDDFIAAVADIVAPAGDPLRRGRLLDEFGALVGEFGVQGFVEWRDAVACRLSADFAPGRRCHQAYGGSSGADGEDWFHGGSSDLIEGAPMV